MYLALEAARKREQTEEFKETYAQRAGVEGVHAQGVRRMGGALGRATLESLERIFNMS